MSWFTKGRESQNSVQPSSKPPSFPTLERRLRKTRKTIPKCLPTYVPGFDSLIFSSTGSGGLPLGKPGMTLLAGGPGTGKSLLTYMITAQQLNYGNKVQFHTFEKAPEVVAYEISRIIKQLDLKIPVEAHSDFMSIEGLEIVDSYYHDYGKQTVALTVRDISEWHKETNGKLVVIDSLTEMVLWEGELRVAIKNFLSGLTANLKDRPEEIAILGTSQHRGARQDPGLAGGIALGHRSNAVVQVDSTFVSQFDKGYFGLPRGTQVRRIWVEKTADFAHSPEEHYLTISPEGICTIGEPIPEITSRCRKCGESIDYSEDKLSLIHI